MEDFATISQLQNECTGLRNGTHVPKGGFTAAKHLAKWGFGCEFLFFFISQLRNGAPVLQNGTRVPKIISQLRKFSERRTCGCEMVSQQSVDFTEASFRLRNLADPCFTPVFALFLTRFCSERLPFNFFAIHPDFDHPKTYITSKQIRIKALKSKLKY